MPPPRPASGDTIYVMYAYGISFAVLEYTLYTQDITKQYNCKCSYITLH